MLLSQEHIKERSKRRQWMRKRDSMGAYYWIINNLSLTNKIILESTHEWIHQDMCIFKIKKCFHIFYTVQVDTVYQKVFDNSYLFWLLRYEIQKTKEHVLHKWGFIVFKSKNTISVQRIKSNWFDFIHYTQIIFWVKICYFYIF